MKNAARHCSRIGIAAASATHCCMLLQHSSSAAAPQNHVAKNTYIQFNAPATVKLPFEDKAFFCRLFPIFCPIPV
jgi:hypothetical protein